MESLHKKLELLRNGGLTNQEMERCVPEIRKSNITTLNWILLMMFCALLILLGVSYVPGFGEASNRYLYLSFAILIGGEYLLYRFFIRHRPQWALSMCYVFMASAYAFGIYESVGMGDDCSVTVFCAFLIVMPILVIDRPTRLTLIVLSMEAILLFAYGILDSVHPGNRFLVLESLCCTFMGVFCTCAIQPIKFSEINNHLKLELQLLTDPLTGIGSRAAYVKMLSEITNTAADTGVAFVDVNGLKTANDKFGHEAGDRLILKAVDLIQAYFTDDTDHLFRIGGDEFVIISTNVRETEFQERYETMTAKDIRSEIISCGYVWLDKVRDGEQAVKAAEKMMYATKQKYYESHPNMNRRSR